MLTVAATAHSGTPASLSTFSMMSTHSAEAGVSAAATPPSPVRVSAVASTGDRASAAFDSAAMVSRALCSASAQTVASDRAQLSRHNSAKGPSRLPSSRRSSRTASTGTATERSANSSRVFTEPSRPRSAPTAPSISRAGSPANTLRAISAGLFAPRASAALSSRPMPARASHSPEAASARAAGRARSSSAHSSASRLTTAPPGSGTRGRSAAARRGPAWRSSRPARSCPPWRSPRRRRTAAPPAPRAA